jgi:hypothetical protein
MKWNIQIHDPSNHEFSEQFQRIDNFTPAVVAHAKQLNRTLDPRRSIMDISELKPGMKILYEERALFSEMDDEHYERQKEFLTEEAFASAYARSPRGYLLPGEHSLEWVDPNNPRRRVVLGVIVQIRDGEIFLGECGTGLSPDDVLEVLPNDWIIGG